VTEYQATKRFLFNLQMFGIKVGLKNIGILLRYLGNPENHFPSIHIAGTNGKGSTSSMIASILTASGYRTGLYTSPHLIDFAERIRIDGQKISAQEIIYYTKILRTVIEKYQITFFEATTAIAFQYFADKKVDVAVIETGLGGRLDATNIITPLLSVITNIGIEHTEHLGTTYSRIASEKGGIIKPFIPCITGTKNQQAFAVLRTIAKINQSKIFNSSDISSVALIKSSLNGLTMQVTTNRNQYNNLFLSLGGEHQVDNLQLALAAIEYVKYIEGFSKIKMSRIVEGLSSIQKYSGLRGRMEVIKGTPLLIADVAHNPDGMEVLASTLRKLIVGKLVVVFGVMRDKAYQKMIESIKPLIRVGIAVSPQIDRALNTQSIMSEFQKQSIIAINGETVAKGFQIARQETRKVEPILVTGSHYVVGETLKFIK